MPLYCRKCKISRELSGSERMCPIHYPEPDPDEIDDLLDTDNSRKGEK